MAAGDINREMLEEVRDDTSGSIRFVDYDTVKQDGERYRISGLTAPEIQQWTSEGVKPSQPGGELAARQAAELARASGFNILRATGDEDAHGRQIAHLTNAQGDDWTDTTYLRGALKPSTFTGERERELYEQGRMARLLNREKGVVENAEDPWVKARLAREADEASRSNIVDKDRFKTEALDEAEFARAQSIMGDYNPYSRTGVRYHTSGARMDNTAFSPMSAGWDSAVSSIKSGLDGVMAAYYDVIDDEEGYKLSSDRAAIGEAATRELPVFVNNVGDVKSFADFGNYTAGLVGSAAPYLFGIMGSAGLATLLAGPGALAAGIGALPAALVYSGQTYNDMEGTMEQKNAGIAFTVGVGMSALDMIGLRGILKPADLLRKDVTKQIAKAYAKENKVSPEAALKIVNAAMKSSSGELVKGLSGLVSLQISKKALGKQVLADVREGAVKEGITEVGQETLGYGGAVLGSEKEFDTSEFGNIALNSLIGGALIGGGISPVLGTGNAIQDVRRIRQQFEYSPEQSVAFSEENSTKVVNTMGEVEVSEAQEADITKEAAKHYEDNKLSNKGIWQWSKDIGKNFVSRPLEWYWKSDMGNTPNKFNEALISMWSPTNRDNISGEAVYDQETRVFAETSGMIHDVLAKADVLFDNTSGAKGRIKSSLAVNDLFDRRGKGESISKGESNILDSINDIATRLNEQLTNITGKDSNITGELLFKSHQPSKKDILKDSPKFIKLLTDFGYTNEEANTILELIEAAPEGSILERGEDGKLIDSRKGGLDNVVPRNLGLKDGLFTIPGMAEFADGDSFKAMEDTARSLVHGAYMQKYVGVGGSKLKKSLAVAKATNDNWDPKFSSDIISAAEIWMGIYNPIQSDKMRRLQSNITSFNLVTLLGTGGPAQLPELVAAFTNRVTEGAGGRPLLEDIRRLTIKVAKHYSTSSREIFAKYWSGTGMTPTSSWEPGRRRFNSGGFSGVKYGALGQQGINSDEINASKLRAAVANSFITISLIKPMTDISRIISDGVSNDAILNYLDVMDTFHEVGKPMTRQVKEAYDMMNTTRVPPLKMLELHKAFKDDIIKEFGSKELNAETYDSLVDYMSSNHSEYAALLDVARKQWVDNALANPAPGSRSRPSQDPHLALLFQFRGYILTFAAAVLPRLVRKATSGNPNQDVQAMTILAGLVAMGFLGQVLKDEWKTEGRPYWLDDAEYVQRGFQASGLMGPFDFLLDAINPIHGERSLTSTAQGLMGPTWGNIKQAGKVLGATVSGEGQEALYSAAKWVPIAGHNKQFRHDVGNILGD
jgi:hypothetical protein